MTSQAPILIIDNDIARAETLTQLLRRWSSIETILHLSRHEQALDYFRDIWLSNKYLPAMIFSELHFPAPNAAFELFKWLKADSALNAIPLIVLTESASRAEVQQAYALGANSCLTRPASPDKFEAMVAMICSFWSHCLLPQTLVPAERARRALRSASNLDWTESKWFDEWLQLARAGQSSTITNVR
jgi:CheY-like chemotaxis protein